MDKLTIHDNVSNAVCTSCGERLSKQERDKYQDICQSCIMDAITDND